MIQTEPDILDAMRPFATAQATLGLGFTTRLGNDRATLGWYGSTVSPLRGSMALVRDGGPYASLVGDVIRLRVGRKHVFAYVLGRTAAIEEDIAITRRLYLALGALWDEPAVAFVEVL